MKESFVSAHPADDLPEVLPLKRRGARPSISQVKPSPSERGHDLWLLTLSDLLLLLVVFFVLLFGLTLQQGGVRFDSTGEQAKTPINAEESRADHPAAPVGGGDSRGALASLEEDLRSILDEKDNKEEVRVTRHANHVVLIFPETIVFDPGQAQLKPSVQPILTKVASLASVHPNLLVEVQGHTDDRPIRNKRYPSNWELSVDRATQVVRALIGLGLNPVQISGRGFGEYRALHPNSSDSNRSKNRRVEIQFSLPPSS